MKFTRHTVKLLFLAQFQRSFADCNQCSAQHFRSQCLGCCLCNNTHRDVRSSPRSRASPKHIQQFWRSVPLGGVYFQTFCRKQSRRIRQQSPPMFAFNFEDFRLQSARSCQTDSLGLRIAKIKNDAFNARHSNSGG